MPMIPPSRAGPLRDNGSHSSRGEGKHMQPLLMGAAGRAARYLDGLPTRRVSPSSSDVEGLEGFFRPLQEGPIDPAQVLDELDTLGSPATVARAGGRVFGFVIRGVRPAALAANILAG